MLTRFLVPNPAVGHDWTWTVPGQYLARIVSVTAQLAALANPTTAADSSANANNATYSTLPIVTWGVIGPYGGSPNLAADINPGVAQNSDVAQFANSAGTFDLAQFTYEALVKPRTLGQGNFETVIGIQTFGGALRDAMMLHKAAPNAAVGYGYSGNLNNFPGGTITLDAWHQIALTYNGTTWQPYADGVALTSSVTGVPDATVVKQPLMIGGNTASGSNIYNGAIAGAAVFSGALTGARILAHFNAIATSSAAYKAAVLADTPLALWMLDETQTRFQRTAILQLTDGTRTLAEYPGFAPSQQSNLFTWTWTTDGSAAAQTTTQSVTIVPITPTTLAPGYTVGVHTLDLTSLDQWSNIVVWADVSDSGGAGGPSGAGALPAYDALQLVPDYMLR